jgi:hypothetical protein
MQRRIKDDSKKEELCSALACQSPTSTEVEWVQAKMQTARSGTMYIVLVLPGKMSCLNDGGVV